jgi:hypothetical protein
VLTIARRKGSKKLKGVDEGWRPKKEGKPKYSTAKVYAYQRKWVGKREETREHAMQGRSSISGEGHEKLYRVGVVSACVFVAIHSTRKHKPHATLSTNERFSKGLQIREPQTEQYTLPTQSHFLIQRGHHVRAERLTCHTSKKPCTHPVHGTTARTQADTEFTQSPRHKTSFSEMGSRRCGLIAQIWTTSWQARQGGHMIQ